jgi:hypothetical protein
MGNSAKGVQRQLGCGRHGGSYKGHYSERGCGYGRSKGGRKRSGKKKKVTEEAVKKKAT